MFANCWKPRVLEMPSTLLLSSYDSKAMATVSVIIDILAGINPTAVNSPALRTYSDLREFVSDLANARTRMPTNAQLQRELEARLRVDENVGATYMLMGTGFATSGLAYTSFLSFEQHSRRTNEWIDEWIDGQID